MRIIRSGIGITLRFSELFLRTSKRNSAICCTQTKRLKKIFEELQDGQNQIELTVSGMSAGCCVREVRRLMERIPEVQKTEVVLDSGQIVLYGQKIPLEQVRNALTAAGFEVVI